jgi:hypothetical protein
MAGSKIANFLDHSPEQKQAAFLSGRISAFNVSTRDLPAFFFNG